MDAKHTKYMSRNPSIDGGHNMHHQYGVIQVQLVLDGPYEGGDGETENINDRISEYPIESCFHRLRLWHKGSEE